MGHLRVTKLGKAYRRYARQSGRLLEWLGLGAQHELKWILRDINFEIQRGEAVGLIGVNGAGKSTLLKLIAGTARPTTGQITVNGRITALLELGMGFHADFTGRENVFMSARIAGIPASDLAAVMAAVEEFAEIGDYIDQPVRTYSSGMQVRLAFSVATAVRPDILIVDEALSVGDTYFQHKSFDLIRRFLAEGTTLLFVSHSAASVKSICTRAILLDQGSIVCDDAPDKVLDYYNALIARSHAEYEIRQLATKGGGQVTRSGSGEARIDKLELIVGQEPVNAMLSGQPAVIRVTGTSRVPLDQITVGILLRDRLGNDVFGTNTMHHGSSAPRREGERFCAEFRFASLPLGSGSYSITAALHSLDNHIAGNYDWWDRALVFEVLAQGPESVGVCRLPVVVGWVDAGGKALQDEADTST
jgi:lipopolysaccharide transport system ATP-binding protein